MPAGDNPAVRCSVQRVLRRLERKHINDIRLSFRIDKDTDLNRECQEKHGLSIRFDHNLLKPYLQKVRDRIRNVQRFYRMYEHSPVRRRDICLTNPAADGTAIMIESLSLLKRNG